MTVQALNSLLILYLKSTNLSVVGATHKCASTSSCPALWQKIAGSDHPQFPRTIRECCHFVSTILGEHGICGKTDNQSLHFRNISLVTISVALTVAEMASHSSCGICWDCKVLCNCKFWCKCHLERNRLANTAQCFVRSPRPHPSPFLWSPAQRDYFQQGPQSLSEVQCTAFALV